VVIANYGQRKLFGFELQCKHFIPDVTHLTDAALLHLPKNLMFQSLEEARYQS
jgi:hypothetical protein